MPETDGPEVRAAIWMSTADSRGRVPAGEEEELDEEDCEREMGPGRLGARQSLRLSLFRSTPSSSDGRVEDLAPPAVCEPELAVRRKAERASAWRGAPRSTLVVELAEGARWKVWAAEGMLVAWAGRGLRVVSVAPLGVESFVASGESRKVHPTHQIESNLDKRIPSRRPEM